MKYLPILMLLLLSTPAKSQQQKGSAHEKGTLFGYWGYNRSAYTKSNMRFVGPGYDFTMQGASATDNPSLRVRQYFRELTVPQFNVRFGYYIKKNWAVSVGYDHMKYVFRDQNEVTLSGTIDPGVDQETNWEGVYNGENIVTNRDQFHYENSDGLNYLRVEFARTDRLWKWGSKHQFAISSSLGVGLGGLLSFNDFVFAGQKDMRTISLSGYGVSLHTGIRFEFFRHVFLQGNLGGGFHHQVKVRTRGNDPSSFARHAYGYSDGSIVLGFLLYLKKGGNACDSCPDW